MTIQLFQRFIFKFVKLLDKIIPKNNNQMVICSNSLRDNLLFFYLYLQEGGFKGLKMVLLTKGNSYDEIERELSQDNFNDIFSNFKEKIDNLEIIKFRTITGLWNFIKSKYVIMKESDGYYQSYFQNNSHKIFVCLWHGIPMKTIGLLNKETNIKNQNKKDFNWTYFLVSSEIEKEIMKKSWKLSDDEIIIQGYPRNEYLLKNKKNELLKKEIRNRIENKLDFKPTKIIMYAPTYRSIKPTKFFPFDDFEIKVLEEYCEQNDVLFILRTHINEYNDDQDGLVKLNNLLESKYFILGNDFIEMQNYLLTIDMLITDYSGSFFDFLLMDKPIYIMPYDYSEYEKRRGFSIDMSDIISNLSITNFAELTERIDKSQLYNENLKDFFEFSKNQFHNYLLKDSLSISENILSEIFKKQNLS